MDPTDGAPPGLGAAKALPAPPFATGAPAFAAAIAGGVAVAFADPAGGTRVAPLDAAGHWGPAAHLALSAVGIAGCGDLAVLGGLRLPDGALVLTAVARGAPAWTAPLPSSGRWLYGPFPACAAGGVDAVWITEDARGRGTLWGARISAGAAGPPAGIPLDARPLEIDVTSDAGGPVAVWTAGPRLGVHAARIAAGASPVFQGLEGSASPHWIRTARGLAWIAVGPQGLRAQRVGPGLAPDGPPIDLGEGFAPILVAAEGSSRAALLARGPRAFAGVAEVAGSTPREEPIYSAPAWAALVDLASLALGPRVALAPAGRYLAAAFAPGALLVIHGEASPQASSLPLR